MIIRLNLRYLLISALLLSLSLCRAQEVPSTVTYNFGTTDDGTQLWDLTGDYSLNVTVSEKNGIQVPLVVDFRVVQDAMGNLHGVSGDFRALTLGDSTLFTVSYTIAGKITGSGGSAQARFVVHFVGNGTVGSLPNVSFSATLVVDASPNSEDGELEGTAKFVGRLGGGLEGVSGTIAPFTPALPAGVDGSWTLSMQLAGLNSLVGSAVITTDAGQAMGFTASGPLNANSTIIARLRASGGIANTTISSFGSSATVNPNDLTFDSGRLSGKLMGQKFLAIPLPPPN